MTLPSSPKVVYTEAQRWEAARWFVVIHSEDDPRTESSHAWLRWIDQDEGNRVAFESVATAWHATPGSSMRAMPSTEDLLADSYSGDEPVEKWLAAQSVGSGIAIRRVGHRPGKRTRCRHWMWLAAASLAAVTLGLFTMDKYWDLRGSQPQEFTTKTGEQMEITFPDGSRGWLGPKSRLLVGFTRARRGIELGTGEAFFSVKKDRKRPFTVRSPSGDITAVGTAFNVRAMDGQVTVAVSEGAVTVAPKMQPTARQPAGVRVASGQQVTFTARESTKEMLITQSLTPGERARWRDGVLVYRDEPLRDVVKDITRYSERQIEISDSAIGDLHYSGVVYKSAVEEWAQALPESFPVKIVSEGNLQVISAR